MNIKSYKLRDIVHVTDYVANGSFESLRNNVQYLDSPGHAILVRLTDFTKKWSRNFKYVTREAYEFLKKSTVFPGDLVMSNVGDPGKLFIVPDLKMPMTLGPNAILIRPIVEFLDIKYLAIYFESPVGKKQIESIVSATAQRKFNKTSFRSLEIPLPPLEDQVRIAHLLGKVEGIIAQRKKDIEQLDQFMKSVFQEMFDIDKGGDPEWPVLPLGSRTEIVSGVTKGKRYQSQDMVEAPYMRVANVQDGRLDLAEIKSITVSVDEFERYKLKKNDLLLTEGGDPDKLGRGALWNNEIEDCIHQNHIFRVRITENTLHPKFVCTLIGSKYGKKYFLKAAKQTTGIASINSTQLKNFPLVIPPNDLQNKFASLAEKADGIKSKYDSSLNEIENLYRAVSDLAFKGELDLSRISIDAIVQIDSPFEMHSDIPNPSMRTTDAEPVAVRAFTRKDIEVALTNLIGPQPFSSLLNKLEENFTIDQQAYHDIRAILYQMTAEKKLDQIFDETKMETVQLADGNSESFVPMRLALR